ncbi:MAG: TonB-dependent receptor [Steroidobacteraceae bacterium]
MDAAGNPVQRTPKWTTSLTADYQKGLSNGGSLFANVLWSHNDGFAWDPSNFYRQDAYDIVNASLGYAFPNSNIEVRAWVTNLTNDEYERIRFAYTLGRLAIDGAPRMYGLSFTIKN